MEMFSWKGNLALRASSEAKLLRNNQDTHYFLICLGFDSNRNVLSFPFFPSIGKSRSASREILKLS